MSTNLSYKFSLLVIILGMDSVVQSVMICLDTKKKTCDVYLGTAVDVLVSITCHESKVR